MTHALHILIFWSFFGGVLSSGMISATIFFSGRLSLSKQIGYAIACGPSMWTLLISAWLLSLVMSIHHKMRKGRPMVPPPAAPRA